MFAHWMNCAQELRKARARKKLIIVHNGDAIDGNHHGTPQLVTMLPEEQVKLHTELMKAFMSECGFSHAKDKIYYTFGTEVHVDSTEDGIGRQMRAQPNGNVNVFNELRIKVNGRRLWFVHHGPNAGRGVNQGNALRNWLRDIFEECKQENIAPPDFVVSSHVHKPYYTVHVGRMDQGYHMLHGMITPSWQAKTRYGYKVSPLQKNKIGMQWFEVTKQRQIIPPVERLMR